MVILKRIKDTYYPKKTANNTIRKTVKAILLNDKNEIALIHIKGNDMFGERDHYELPGGGVNKCEDKRSAFKREIAEELGIEALPLKYIGRIDIEYNLLKRIDRCYFYIGKAVGTTCMRREEYEKELFDNIVWVNLNDVESFYQNNQAVLVGNMIHTRDLAAIKKAKKKILTILKNSLE